VRRYKGQHNRAWESIYLSWENIMWIYYYYLCVYNWPRRNELYKTVLIHPALQQPLVSEGLMVSDFEGLTHGKVTSWTLTRYIHSLTFIIIIHNIYIVILPLQVSYDYNIGSWHLITLYTTANTFNDNIVRVFSFKHWYIIY